MTDASSSPSFPFPLDGAAIVEAAPLVIGTSRADFRAFLVSPPPWEQAHLAALAWVVDPTAGRLLLVRHRLHEWSCPGGHVDPKEHPAAAAARELREEVGIAGIPTIGPLTVGSAVGCARAPDARHWALGFLFHVDSRLPLHAEPGQPALWYPFDALPTPRTSDIDVVVAHLTRPQ